MIQDIFALNEKKIISKETFCLMQQQQKGKRYCSSYKSFVRRFCGKYTKIIVQVKNIWGSVAYSFCLRAQNVGL